MSLFDMENVDEKEKQENFLQDYQETWRQPKDKY
jgi:hypothetical protein